jgi:radical SAM superfamily enzyme YgiQ (UPF0313 family)
MENLAAEIGEMYDRYRFNILIIADELFAMKSDRLRSFSEMVLEGRRTRSWDFNWGFQTHASARLDLETLQLAKRAGCFLFSYGLESASPVVLKSMNKKIEPRQVVEAMERAHKSGIGFSANLIFGDVAETVDTWAESLAFWLEHCREDFVFLGNLMPYPGSKLFDDMRKYGAFQDKKFYYEHIDQGAINMSTIPPEVFEGLAKVNMELEKGWLFVKEASNVKMVAESTSGDMTWYKLTATCPYCQEEIVYRQPMQTTKGFKLGTGCTKCNRKIVLKSA